MPAQVGPSIPLIQEVEEAEFMTENNAGSVIYILGAGFSCGAGLPLSNNFIEKMGIVRNEYNSILKDHPVSVKEPIKELFQFHARKQNLFDESLINNIEFLLSLVSAITLGGISSRGFTKYKMQIAIAQTIAHYVNLSSQTGYIDKFVRQIRSSTNQSTIITLNYDDLIERSCERVQKKYRYGFKKRGYDGYFDIDQSDYVGAMLDTDEDETSMPIYKLHGSYNWLTENGNGSVRLFSDMQRFFSNKSFWGGGEWVKHGLVIEPPTIDKMYAGRVLSVIWGRAYESLVSATSITVIGYSFPENDGYVKYLLMASLSDNDALEKFTIVDPCCCENTYKTRINWLKILLEKKKVKLHFCQEKAEDWILSK